MLLHNTCYLTILLHYYNQMCTLCDYDPAGERSFIFARRSTQIVAPMCALENAVFCLRLSVDTYGFVGFDLMMAFVLLVVVRVQCERLNRVNVERDEAALPLD